MTDWGGVSASREGKTPCSAPPPTAGRSNRASPTDPGQRLYDLSVLDSLRFYGVIQYFKETHTRIIDRKNSTVLLSFRNKNLNLEQYFLIVDYFVVVSNLDSLTVLKNCQHGAIQPTSLPEKIRFLAITIHFKYKMLQLIE